MVCKKCGKEFDGKFCPYCGHDSTKPTKDELASKRKETLNKVKEKVKPATAFVVKHKIIFAVATAVVLLAIIIGSVVGGILSNDFRVGKMNQIEIGMTKDQVKKQLGEAHSDEASVWIYYSKNYKKLMDEAESLEKKLENITSTKEFESIAERMLKLEEMSENLVHDEIRISFSADKVYTVEMLKEIKNSDKEIKKTVKKAKLSVKKVERFSIVENLYGIVEYKDGSYRKSPIIPKNTINTEYEGKQKVTWHDEWSDSDVTAEIKIVKNNSLYRQGKINNVEYFIREVDGGYTLSLVGTGGFDAFGNEYPWNDIAGDIKAVSISEGITSIGENAFKGCLLKELKVRAEVAGYYGASLIEKVIITGGTTIAEGAFKGLNGLSVEIPASVTGMGAEAFYNTVVIIYLEAAEIPSEWSDWRSDLTSVVLDYKNNDIPTYGRTMVVKDSVRYEIVDGEAVVISQPDGISTINISSTVTLGNNTYNVTRISDKAFEGNTTLTSVTIPDSVKSIGDSAFSDCGILTSVTIGNGVTSIGDQAFYGCDGLTSITIPDSVISIGDSAFEDCIKLNTVTISNNVSRILKNTFKNTGLYNNTADNSIVYADKWAIGFKGNISESITIKDGVVGIADEAFYEESNLARAVLPLSIAYIGEYAFSRTTIIINADANSVIYVDKWAVGYKGTLGDITLKEDTVGIADKAFYDCSSLTSITIPDSVTSIGSEAFNKCTNLTSIIVGENNEAYTILDGILYNKEKTSLIMAPPSITSAVTIPNSVTSIEKSAFNGCTNLASVTIPNSVTSIGESAFENCDALTNITMPNSVTSISERMFYDCDGLTSITIPNSVTSIGDNAFSYCRNLTSVTIPNSVTSIGKDAFYSCSLSELRFTGTFEQWCARGGLGGSISYGSLYINGQKITGDVVIPDGVTSIGDYAFYDCDGFTSITIPNSVTNIGSSAFAYCSNLTSVTIGNGVTSIGYRAFYDCNKISEVRCTGTIEQWCTISGLSGIMYYGTSGKKLYINGQEITGNLVIPDGVTRIGSGAFYKLYGLTSVTIPDSVKSIGYEAFYRCSYLANVVLSDSITSIGDKAFYGCDGLTSITIPNNVTSIGENAFSDCSSLTKIEVSANNATYSSQDGVLYDKGKTRIICVPIAITGSLNIPDSVTYINGNVFSGCKSLTKIEVSTNNAKYSSQDGVLYNKRKTEIIYVPKAITGAVIIPSGITYIGTWFYDRDGLTSITIPNSVTSIGDSAFYDCAGLSSITIGNGVTSIGQKAFWNCDSLTSVTIGNSVTSLGDYAFYDCDGLTSITIPNSVTSIGDYAFYSCNSLISITIGNSVTSIGDYAFEGCTSLTSITIPNSVTSIGSSAFRYCTSLTSVTIGNSVTSIGYEMFYKCSNLTSVIIGNSVKSIGKEAFYECSNLTSITIPNSVTSIGDYAFYDCSKISEVRFTGTIEQWCARGGIYDIMRRGVSDKKLYINGQEITGNLVIPDGVTSIGEYAFYKCSNITSVTIPDSVTSIESSAFWDCDSLTSVTIGNSVTSIGDNAFEGCTSLTSITIPNSVTSIGERAFLDCSSLTSITIGNSVTSIGNYAFEGCTSLTSITIPNSVTSIGSGAFYNCTSLTSVVYNGTMSKWKSISKKYNSFNNTGSFTVKCTDGTLSKTEALK